MKFVIFYPDQDEKLFSEYVSTLTGDVSILSWTPLNWTASLQFKPGEFPTPDDSLFTFLKFLKDNPQIDNLEIELLDWTNNPNNSDFEKLKKTNCGVSLVEEGFSIQDFRLAPYMENLLKICGSLKLPGAARLFSSNPKVLFPKIIKGKAKDIKVCLERFCLIRQNIPSKNFTGVLPIFNSEFYKCD